MAAAQGYPVYLFGASPAKCPPRPRGDCACGHPRLSIVGRNTEMWSVDDTTAPGGLTRGASAVRIHRGPAMVVLALGCPKQELWMARHAAALAPAVAIGLGASLDFVAGAVTRAPGWVSAAGHRVALPPGAGAASPRPSVSRARRPDPPHRRPSIFPARVQKGLDQFMSRSPVRSHHCGQRPDWRGRPLRICHGVITSPARLRSSGNPARSASGRWSRTLGLIDSLGVIPDADTRWMRCTSPPTSDTTTTPVQEAVAACERLGIPFAIPAHSFQLNRALPADRRAVADGYLHYVLTVTHPDSGHASNGPSM